MSSKGLAGRDAARDAQVSARALSLQTRALSMQRLAMRADAIHKSAPRRFLQPDFMRAASRGVIRRAFRRGDDSGLSLSMPLGLVTPATRSSAPVPPSLMFACPSPAAIVRRTRMIEECEPSVACAIHLAFNEVRDEDFEEVVYDLLDEPAVRDGGSDGDSDTDVECDETWEENTPPTK